MTKPKISVLMLNWNTSKHTMECLESFRKQPYRSYEIVLVDNGSTDEDYRELKSGIGRLKGIKVILKRFKKNVGITGGMNFAYRFARGDYIIFMNNDMIVTKDFLKEALAPFENYEGVGAVVPMIKTWRDGPTNEVQLVGGKMTFYGTLMNKGLEKFGSKVYNKESDVDCATAACFVIPRSVLRKLGEVFPPLYSVYFEDIDLSWRVRNAGLRIVYTPKSLVYHKGSMSVNLNEMPDVRQRFIMRNKYLTFWRNLPVHEFAFIFPFMIGFDLLRLLKQTLKGRLVFVKCSAEGFADFLTSTDKVRAPRGGSISMLSWEFENPRSIVTNWAKR